MPQSKVPAEGYLYRGIHAGHPSYWAALTGAVVPGDVNGTITPKQHNLRESSALSPYTSWTHLRQIAINFAMSRGAGGLLLRLPLGTPKQDDDWHWEMSPDAWLEDEVLLHGVRIGAEVTRL